MKRSLLALGLFFTSVTHVLADGSLTLEGCGICEEAPCTPCATDTDQTFTATLRDGDGNPLPGQYVSFLYLPDHEQLAKKVNKVTNASGVATITNVNIETTRIVGIAAFAETGPFAYATVDFVENAEEPSQATKIQMDTPCDPCELNTNIPFTARLIDGAGMPIVGKYLRFVYLPVGNQTPILVNAVTDANGEGTMNMNVNGATMRHLAVFSETGPSMWVGVEFVSAPVPVQEVYGYADPEPLSAERQAEWDAVESIEPDPE